VSLNGPWTLVVIAGLALAAPIVAIVFWNRLPDRLGRPALAWPLRGSMLLACQITACLLAAVVLNNYGQFYTSWSELLGNGPQVTVHQRSDRGLTARIQAQLATQHHQPGHSAIVSVPIPQAGGNRTNDALVYLPAAYFEPSYRHRVFPVIELLDGFPGSPSSWIRPLHLQRTADAEIASGRALPFVAVMPVQNYQGPGKDGECLDVPGGEQVETTLTTNVRDVVLKSLRVAPQAGRWAVAGYSTGGYCALNIAMRHPEWYSTAVSIMGYTQPFEDKQTGPVFAGLAWLRHSNEPLWRVQHLALPRLKTLFLASKRDGVPYSEALTFSHYVRPPLTMSELFLPRGGHNFQVIAAMEPVCLDWASTQIGPPTTAPIVLVDGLAPRGLRSAPDPSGPSANRTALRLAEGAKHHRP
jgi:pimeloyl-ACP methyl ester carboxylesterase